MEEIGRYDLGGDVLEGPGRDQESTDCILAGVEIAGGGVEGHAECGLTIYVYR